MIPLNLFKLKNYLKYSLRFEGHFRNKTLVHYFFNELMNEGITVNLNFFGEKHGKSSFIH